jgi:hypothetical protein
VECLSSTGKKGVSYYRPHQQSSGRVMVRQSHSRANSSTGTGDCKVIDHPFYVKCGKKTPWGLLSLPRAMLCVQRRGS